MRTAAELEALSRRAAEADQCTPHARRPEHADRVASPPPDAVSRWVGPNGAVDLLCRSCLRSWMDNALEDPDLLPHELVVFLWRRG